MSFFEKVDRRLGIEPGSLDYMPSVIPLDSQLTINLFEKAQILFAYRENLERHLSKANEKRIIIIFIFSHQIMTYLYYFIITLLSFLMTFPK